MVLGRLAFGYRGNVAAGRADDDHVPASGGSRSTASAARSRCHARSPAARLLWLVIVVLVQIVIAFFGHNLVQAFERWAFPVLAVVFVVAAVVVLAQVRPVGVPAGAAAPAASAGSCSTVGAAFGYAAGWNPYAADYTRYLPADGRRAAHRALRRPRAVPVLRMILGAASARVGQPPAGDRARTTRPRPSPACCPRCSATLTLLAIAIGAVAANVLNIYSGAMSFLTIGIKLPLHIGPGHRRAGLRRGRFPHRAGRRCGDAAHELRELPADHRLLDRAVARRGVRRPVPAPRPACRSSCPLRPLVQQLGRADRDGRRHGGLGGVVLQPGEVRRAGAPRRARASATSRSSSASCWRRRSICVLCRSQDRRASAVAVREMDAAGDARRSPIEEARKGLAEGGIPIGAALFTADGMLLGSGHNRRVQDDDPSMHGETDAFRAAGRQRDYRVHDHGDDAVAVLVLQRAGAPVRHRGGGDRGGSDVHRRARLAGRARRGGHGARRRAVRGDDG